MLVLVWVQTVCKGYQQMAKAAATKERVKYYNLLLEESILGIQHLKEITLKVPAKNCT